MDPARVTQQTSSALSLRGELAHDAPTPRALRSAAFPVRCSGPSRARAGASCGRRWTWRSCASPSSQPSAGCNRPFTYRPSSAPLLALPPLVLLLFYLRGLYRTRLRAIVLDGVVPVLSGVSVAAMAVAILGKFLNHEVPSQGAWLRAWLFALVAVGLGRITLASVSTPRAPAGSSASLC